MANNENKLTTVFPNQGFGQGQTGSTLPIAQPLANSTTPGQNVAQPQNPFIPQSFYNVPKQPNEDAIFSHQAIQRLANLIGGQSNPLATLVGNLTQAQTNIQNAGGAPRSLASIIPALQNIYGGADPYNAMLSSVKDLINQAISSHPQIQELYNMHRYNLLKQLLGL
jgi:hypothetical protein